jgi:hypothetical protein
MLVALALDSASAQQLGHKLLGSAGIDAGVQAARGLTVIDHTLAMRISSAIGTATSFPSRALDSRATGSAVGVSYTHKAKGTPISRSRPELRWRAST